MAPNRDEIPAREDLRGERARDAEGGGSHGEDELAWLAFCYITGELVPAEAAEFEVRLESDQAAREAVAAVVEWTAAVETALHGERLSVIDPASLHQAASAPAARRLAMSHSSRPRSSPPHWKIPAGGMALAAAASLAAVLIAYSLAGRNERAPSASDPRESASLDRRLADAWAASAWRDGTLADRDALADDERPREFDLLPEEFSVEVVDQDGQLVAGDGGSALPTWDLAAGDSAAGDSADGDSADGELMISDWLWEAVSGAQEASPAKSDHQANQGEG